MNHEQNAINDKILQSLDDIQTGQNEIVDKIDNLEHTITKKATAYGAVAGAVSGGIISVGLEFIKLKWGG